MYKPHDKDFYETYYAVIDGITGIINKVVVKELRVNNCVSKYANDYFYAIIYYTDGRYQCVVKMCGKIVGIHKSFSIRRLKKKICKLYSYKIII